MGALIHITGGQGMSMRKVNKVLNGMSEPLHQDAQVIFGARVDPQCEDMIRVMAVITGIKEVPQHVTKRSKDKMRLNEALEEMTVSYLH